MQSRGIRFLESLPLWSGSSDYTIELPRQLLEALGNPQDALPAVHVAGTNGKGTVSALVSAMLLADGKSVGQFASPYLTHITERCIINGLPVGAEEFGLAVEQVRAAADAQNITPSLFEYATAASFLEFQRRALDWMVIEVGLGGTRDATNTMARPELSVITNIGYDHTHILGETLEEIAREKAGIFRPGVPVFVGVVSAEVRAVLLELARECGAPIEFLSAEPSSDFQRDNIRLAVRIAQALGLSETAIDQGLNRANWPGRLERLRSSDPSNLSGVHCLLDAAHNPDGAEGLARYLSGEQKLVYLASFLERKNWQQMIDIFSGAVADTTWVFTSSGHQSAVPPEDLASYAGSEFAERDLEQALAKAVECCGSEALLVATGSIYLVGAVRPLLTNRPFSTYVV